MSVAWLIASSCGQILDHNLNVGMCAVTVCAVDMMSVRQLFTISVLIIKTFAGSKISINHKAATAVAEAEVEVRV